MYQLEREIASVESDGERETAKRRATHEIGGRT
jgi:hypothetical protein